jgi:hypothetical protein
MRKLKILLFSFFCAGIYLRRKRNRLSGMISGLSKNRDSAHFPGTNKILFVGSSSFTNWKDVQDIFLLIPLSIVALGVLHCLM